MVFRPSLSKIESKVLKRICKQVVSGRFDQTGSHRYTLSKWITRQGALFHSFDL